MSTILFKNVNLPEYYGYNSSVNILVKDKIIAYIGKYVPTERVDKEIEGNGNLVIPAFYNAHCHSAMTLFRGYGDDLPLQRWLEERIFPAEDKLDGRFFWSATALGLAEMIASGVTCIAGT